jgi:hypothetical protein
MTYCGFVYSLKVGGSMITEKDIGRKVIVNGGVSDLLFTNSSGKLVNIVERVPHFGIYFDTFSVDLHDCDGACEFGFGWYVNEENIKFVDEEASTDVSDKYYSLKEVLDDALSQANSGKGLQRHANDNSFEDQVICVVGRLLKGHRYAAHAYQAIKKTIEAGRLYDIKGKDAAYQEILGAINYLSALAIMIKEDKDANI